MILSQDWLEEMSPMWVDWKKKIMRFTYKGSRIELNGVQDQLVNCQKISGTKFQGLLKHSAVTHCIQLNTVPLIDPSHSSSGPIQEVFSISKYLTMCLNPLRNCYSSMIISLRSPELYHHKEQMIMSYPWFLVLNLYRYSPIQKDEIEARL